MTSLRAGIARTSDEMRQCFGLRYSANVADGKRSTYLDHTTRMVRDELDEIATIHCVKDGDRVVATMRSVWGGDTIPDRYREWYSLDRFQALRATDLAFTSRLIIEPQYRKKNALALLLAGVYRSGRAKDVKVDFMHASPELIGMYERIGYQCFRKGVLDTDVGCHVPMLLTADAHDWLASIRSPFFLATSGFQSDNSRRSWFAELFSDYVGGMTPNLLGEAAFVRMLIRLGAGDVWDAIRFNPDRVRRTAIFVARGGDIVARSRDNFGANLVQLTGGSELRSGQSLLASYSGQATIEAFVHREPAAPIELVAIDESAFLCTPALAATVKHGAVAQIHAA